MANVIDRWMHESVRPALGIRTGRSTAIAERPSFAPYHVRSMYHTSVVETRPDCGAAIIRTVPCMYYISVVETRAASEGTDITVR